MDYEEREYPVRMPYESYNIAVDFLRTIWLKDYQKEYDMVVMLGFLGLTSLDNASLEAFRSHVVRKVRPVMVRNLTAAKLIPSEPYDTYCQFLGTDACFTVELVRIKDRMKVYSLDKMS